MDVWVVVLFVVVVLHFVAGFVYLIYKLSPRKKEDEQSETSEGTKQEKE